MESFRALVEVECFVPEQFRSRDEFSRKAIHYQTGLNCARPFSIKEKKTPAQILAAEPNGMKMEVLLAPAIDIDQLAQRQFNALVEKIDAQGGDDEVLPKATAQPRRASSNRLLRVGKRRTKPDLFLFGSLSFHSNRQGAGW